MTNLTKQAKQATQTMPAIDIPARTKIILGKPTASSAVHEVDTVDIRPPALVAVDVAEPSSTDEKVS